jgi:hypothetical protein
VDQQAGEKLMGREFPLIELLRRAEGGRAVVTMVDSLPYRR